MGAGALLVGIGYGPITPASSHLLSRTTPAHRMSLVFSVKQTGVPLGAGLAGAIVPGLQLVAGWQAALLAVAAGNLVCAVVSQPLRAAFDADRDRTRRVALGNFLQPVQMVLSHAGLRMLAGCSFLFSIAQLSLTTYVVTFLTDSLAYGLVAAGALLTVSQVGAVLGRVVWGYASDRWFGARRMLALLAALMALSTLATAALQHSAPNLLVACVLFIFGACAVGWNGVYLAEVARQAPPGLAGVATGGTLAITFLGVVLGPPLFGAVSSAFGSYRAGFAALALPLAICAIALLRKPSGRQQ
jgi:predicted MFS family arabinose efflux permease